MTVSAAQKSGSWGVWLREQVRARLGLFVLTYAALMAAGACVVILIPSRYEARAELKVEGPDRMTRPLSLVATDSYRNEVLSTEVFGRAEKQLRGEGKGTERPDYEVSRRLGSSVNVTTVPEKGLVVITGVSGSGQEAAAFANAMAEAYQETQKERAEASEKTHAPEIKQRRDLEEKLKVLTTERDAAKNALGLYDDGSRTTFGHEGDLAAGRKDLETQLSRAQTEGAEAKIQVQGLTEGAARVEKELGETPEFVMEETVTITSNPERVALQAEIAQHERELSMMLRRLTEKHPDVVQKRAIIEQKKEDLAKMDRRVEDSDDAGKKPNPVYVQMKDSLEQTRMKLQQAEYAVKQKSADEERLKQSLADLDVRVTERKKLTESLSAAETKVKAAGDELKGLNDKLGVIEAGMVVPELRRAEAPEVPVGPFRGGWMAPLYVLAVAGAAGATLVMPMVDKKFASGWEVERGLKLPVVGKVTRIESEGERRMRRAGRRAAEAGVCAALGAGAALVAVLMAFPTLTLAVRLYLFKS